MLKIILPGLACSILSATSAQAKTLHCVNDDGNGERQEAVITFNELDDTKVETLALTKRNPERNVVATYRFNSCQVCDRCFPTVFLRHQIDCSGEQVAMGLGEIPGFGGPRGVVIETKELRGYQWHYDMNVDFFGVSLQGQAGPVINGCDYE